MKKSDKYNYVDGRQINEDSGRIYDVAGYRLPSVTSILSRTKDQQFIKDWKAKVGEKKAEEIKNLSSKRGTLMHKYLEHYVLGKGYEDLTELGQTTKKMANKVIEVGLTPVEGYYGSEITLYYPGLYAGTTDLVCIHNDMETIVDFKQSNRPKKKEWIDDYFLQSAAYAMAHDHVHDSKIRQCVIMICTPDLYFQEYRIQDHELREWKHRFLVRLDMYYNLKNN